MGDNDKLLKTVLNIHYHDKPKVVADVMQVIQNYCDKDQTNSAYEEVLKTIHDLMIDLPPNILLYFLTTVPLPEHEDGTTSPFSELMKKSRVTLLDNMQLVLTEYINSTVPSLISINEDLKTECEDTNEENNGNVRLVEEKPTSSKRKMSTEDFNPDSSEYQSLLKKRDHSLTVDASTSCLKLVEICAEYVVSNLNELRQFYNQKNKTVWAVVNQNTCNLEEQTQCYKHIEDINRKLKWLRMIEAGHISVDVIKELYGNSEIFLKERQLYNLIDESAFTVSKELEEAIENFINS